MRDNAPRTPDEDLFATALEPELPAEFPPRLWTVLVSVVMGVDESTLYDKLSAKLDNAAEVSDARAQIATARGVARALVALCDAADRVVDAKGGAR